MRHQLVRAFVVVSLLSLTLLLAGCAGMGVALETGIVPSFDRQFTLYGQHILSIHHGPTGIACRPDQEPLDRCARRTAQQRVFTIRLISSEAARTLVTIQLPER
jgi:hypothetical protein